MIRCLDCEEAAVETKHKNIGVLACPNCENILYRPLSP